MREINAPTQLLVSITTLVWSSAKTQDNSQTVDLLIQVDDESDYQPEQASERPKLSFPKSLGTKSLVRELFGVLPTVEANLTY